MIGKDSLLLCGLIIVAFTVLVRVSVGLSGYSGELSNSYTRSRDAILQELANRLCTETTKHKDTGWKLLLIFQLVNGTL